MTTTKRAERAGATTIEHAPTISTTTEQPATPQMPVTRVSDMPPLRVIQDRISVDDRLARHESRTEIEWQLYRRRARVVIAVTVTACLLLLVALLVGMSRSQPAAHARTAPTPTPTTLISPFTGTALNGVIAF